MARPRPRIRTCRPEKLEEIKKIIKKWKPWTKKEIADLANCSEGLVEKVLRINPIEVPFSVRKKPVEQIVLEIQDEERKKQVAQIILPYIYEIAKKQLSESEKLAYEDLIKINAKLKRKMINPWEDVLTALTRYHQSLKNQKKVSLNELVESLKLSSQDLSRYLKYAGRKPLGLGYERKSLPLDDKKKLENAFNITMPVPDLDYFLYRGLKVQRIYKFLRKMQEKGLKRPSVKSFIKQIGKRDNIQVLNYQTCSKIYEAVEAGFTKKEILEYTETNNELLEYALNNELLIRPKIIEALKILFPEKNPRFPYRTW